MKKLPLAFLALSLAALSAAALADNPQLYKWTDAQGVIHYSDKPPAGDTANVQALSLPALPPQDTTRIAAEQAQFTAQVAAMQQLVQARQQAQQQQAMLAARQAALDAQAAQLQQAIQHRESRQVQQELTQPPPAIFFHSQFVPGSYRRNLYLPASQPAGIQTSGRSPFVPPSRPLANRPPVSLLGKPRT